MSEDKKIGFPKKWKRYLDGFEETAESMETDELKKKLIEFQKYISQTEKDMEDDTKLNDAKELVKELRTVYTDIINQCRARTKYIIYVLDSRGQ